MKPSNDSPCLQLSRQGRSFMASRTRCVLGLVCGLVATLVLAGEAAAVNITSNSSLEDLNGTFVNTTGNYMALAAGSTIIPGWLVSPGTTGSIVWGKSPTVDAYTAADGILFVDLTGFGSNSSNRALQQAVATTGGVTYGFTMDVASINNGVVLATIGSHTVVLSPGVPFVVAATSWTPMTGTFIGDPLESAPLLKVMNVTPGADIVFIDNISLTGPAQASVPQPGVLVLLLSGGTLMSLMRWRDRRPSA